MAPMEHWSDRLGAAFAASDFKSKAQLARKAGVAEASVRKYFASGVAQPRGPVMGQLAAALGVELLWLQEGVAPMRAGEMAADAAGPGEESGDAILHRREVARRIAGVRLKRQIASPESAALGTIISGARWRRIEAGAASPSPMELQAISNRLQSSLDWLVSGHVTPIDEYDPVATERVRRHLQESADRPPRKSGI